jgi:hypothetical protein
MGDVEDFAAAAAFFGRTERRAAAAPAAAEARFGIAFRRLKSKG